MTVIELTEAMAAIGIVFFCGLNSERVAAGYPYTIECTDRYGWWFPIGTASGILAFQTSDDAHTAARMMGFNYFRIPEYSLELTFLVSSIPCNAKQNINWAKEGF